MADTGMVLVVTAGTLTFGNEWYQNHELNWRVPIATVLAAAGVGIISRVSPRGGTGLGTMALIAALAAPVTPGGKSPIQEIASIVNAKPSKNSIQKKNVG